MNPSAPPRFFHYAFLDGRLIGSENPSLTGSPRQVIERLLSDGRPTFMLTLTPTCPQHRIAHLVQHHLPMAEIPRRERVCEAVELVGRQLAEGRRVWVHCQHGIDRTGCVIGAYLVGQGEPPEQVLESLLDRFPPARRDPRMLRFWAPFAELIRSFAPPTRPPASS